MAVKAYSVNSIKLSLAKSNPPQLVISAEGQTTTTGWRNPTLVPLEKELSPDGILDLEFVADPPGPDNIVAQVFTNIHADLTWQHDIDRLVGVRIVARSNEKTILRVTPAPEIPADIERILREAAIAKAKFPVRGDWSIYHGEKIPWGETDLAPGLEGQKPFIGETGPALDDPKPPFGEDFGRDFEELIRRRYPFGRR